MNPDKSKNGAGQSASILVVDDIPANLQVLAGMLKDCGYKVRPVPSGKLALLAARRNPPDLILLDIHMPEMNGYEVCEHLKADDQLTGIPVIFISALTEQLDKVTAFAIGGVDYLTKPFQIEELHARVETHLKLRRLQIELEEANTRLEKTNGVLCRKQEELSDLHNRKDEFLAMLSHELRNPLAPILNAVHLLRLQKNENQLQHQARTIIERQVTQLTRLVDDLMEVSRITTGRVQLRHDRVVVSGIVERAVETARPLMDQRGHELTVSLPPQPIWLNADAARLQQVVVNLLTNAAKYTADGGHVWLSVQREGDECVLRLRDTGVGIAPEILPHIFDLFTQAERSLDRSQGGLGIGLALVHRLVEMHQGRVEAYSALGHGSEFVVRLPVAPAPAPQPPSTFKETAEPAGPSLRVLVVDDNVDTAQTLAMLLKTSGHDVRTAHTGPNALEATLDYQPNVVLLDIGLPGLNGYEVAKRIRQQPVLHNIVLVAMTGYGQETDRQLSQESGFDHHLVKPADFGKVQQILATISEKASPH
jgi:signal transduction histidine kinase